MPLRVSNTVEKGIVSTINAPFVLGAGVSKIVLPDVSSFVGAEFAGRYIQNVGANSVYYALGHDCDAKNFNGILGPSGTLDANGFGPGQQFDASNCGCSVSVFSVSGTTIAITLLRRNDLNQGSGGILNFVNGQPSL